MPKSSVYRLDYFIHNLIQVVELLLQFHSKTIQQIAERRLLKAQSLLHFQTLLTTQRVIPIPIKGYQISNTQFTNPQKGLMFHFCSFNFRYNLASVKFPHIGLNSDFQQNVQFLQQQSAEAIFRGKYLFQNDILISYRTMHVQYFMRNHIPLQMTMKEDIHWFLIDNRNIGMNHLFSRETPKLTYLREQSLQKFHGLKLRSTEFKFCSLLLFNQVQTQNLDCLYHKRLVFHLIQTSQRNQIIQQLFSTNLIIQPMDIIIAA
ncbi:Hypothetical_protein [Hexamita inflata]|uniref:Hypothetical_protein n=1 Tax=Hexamita inflata TaxID=28002 RepID=A0AA86NX26_9EUKA|nr:Hypothetical protein HINF_LOCUS14886 [Hexamita inflata]